MHCNEFRNLIFERLSGELSPEQDAACAQHELSCAACRAELTQFRAIAMRLRSGWPSEEPLPVSVVLPQQPARTWFDVGALWFSRASAGLVAASLLFLVLARPSVQVGRGGMQMAFGAAVAAPTVAASTVNEAQVKAIVASAVDQRMSKLQPVAAPAASAPAPDVTQVAMQVRQLERTEATLWQAVQQHGLYLDALWRSTENSARPAGVTR